MKSDNAHHRFAISVNRKIGNAVQRNFIKRKMKELYRTNRQLVSRPHDLWIVTKGRFGRTDSPEVEQLFIQALKKIEGSKNR